MSIVGVGRVAGDISASKNIDQGSKIASLISLIAGLNIALFVFNLFPLLPLDGGHIAGALWEAIRNAFNKLRGVKKLKPLDTARLMPATYIVGLGLLIMGVILIYSDIVNPIRIF
jgi:membrane-associated protease RseP (regulator of RpoE activity)